MDHETAPKEQKSWALMNYSEKQILEIINRVSNSLGAKFKFNYNSLEDMKQEAVIIALGKLHNYNPDKGGLEGFLWSVIHNGLFNLKRNKYNRPDAPNQAKKNVLSPIGYDSVQNIDKESGMTWDQKHDAQSDYKMISTLIDNNISTRFRPLWLKMKNGVDMSAIEKAKVLKEIHEILEKNGININNNGEVEDEL